MRYLLPLILILLAPIAYLNAQPIVGEQPQGIELPMKLEMDELVNMTVLPNGVVKVSEEVKATSTGYLLLKNQYPMPFLFKRFIEMDKTLLEIENMTVNFDDVNKRVTADYVALGMAAKRRGVWELRLEGKPKLTTRTGNTLVFTTNYPLPLGGKKNVIITIHLPEGARDVKVSAEKWYTSIRYTLPGSSENNFLWLAVAGVLGALLVVNLIMKDGLLGLFKRKKGELAPLPS